MSRTLLSALFLTVAVTVTVAAHYYVWRRLVRATALRAPYRRWATASLIALALSIPVTFALLRLLPRNLPGYVTFPTFVWMGTLFFLFTLLLAGDVGRGLFHLVHKLFDWPISPERRLFIARVLGGASGLGALTAGAFAMRSAFAEVAVEEVRVKLKRLPASMHGTTIVQLSDIHVGPTIGRDFIEYLVARTNELAPDIVAITGDLVDGTPEKLFSSIEPLKNLRARYGVYFVTGNHEYYAGVDAWMPKLKDLGIRVLRNERVHIGESEAGFDLAGVDDPTARMFSSQQEKHMQLALAGRDQNKDVVLLAHQPKAAFEASQYGVALQLSGHTHGGQIWPFGYLVGLTQPFMQGMGKMGDTLVYVNRGTGFWGPPMRLRAPAEITRVVLESAHA